MSHRGHGESEGTTMCCAQYCWDGKKLKKILNTVSISLGENKVERERESDKNTGSLGWDVG